MMSDFNESRWPFFVFSKSILSIGLDPFVVIACIEAYFLSMMEIRWGGGGIVFWSLVGIIVACFSNFTRLGGGGKVYLTVP